MGWLCNVVFTLTYGKSERNQLCLIFLFPILSRSQIVNASLPPWRALTDKMRYTQSQVARDKRSQAMVSQILHGVDLASHFVCHLVTFSVMYSHQASCQWTTCRVMGQVIMPRKQITSRPAVELCGLNLWRLCHLLNDVNVQLFILLFDNVFFIFQETHSRAMTSRM